MKSGTHRKGNANCIYIGAAHQLLAAMYFWVCWELVLLFAVSAEFAAASRSSRGFSVFMDRLTTTPRFHPAGISPPTRLSSFTLSSVFHFSSSFHVRGTSQNVLLRRGRSGTRSFHAPLALMRSHAGRLWKVVQTPRWDRPCSLSHGLRPQTRCPPTSSKMNNLGEV